MRKNREKYKLSNFQKIKNSVQYLLIIIVLGSFVGSIMGYYRIGGYQNITDTEFLYSNLGDTNYIAIILKNFKYLIVIWFLGFINLGNIVIFLLAFIKGFSFGFTTAVLFQQMSIDGLKYAIFTYVPQSFIYIPFYIFISIKAIQHIKERNNNYYKLLQIIIIFSILISFIDILILKII